MEPKILRNAGDYRSALTEAERLVALDSLPDSANANRLELLSILISDYEQRNFPFNNPDPIDAIEFRMQEQGLRQRDLVALIGSRSRVSEVLARKRPLTVQMIRALSGGLGIPLAALINEPTVYDSGDSTGESELEWRKFPAREMEKRGWFNSIKLSSEQSLEDAVKAFLISVTSDATASAMYRRRFRGEALDQKAYYSALAWTARIVMCVNESSEQLSEFDPNRINVEFFQRLAQLSWLDEGPIIAVEFLAKHGIAVVVEPSLPNVLIDGAAMFTNQGIPVIGLTLRHDRLDYFWFTLLHEIAHIWKHLGTRSDAFVDRIENMGTTSVAEKEANRIARDAFIPRGIWKRSPAFLSPSKENIRQLADDLHIHPAIVVGRLQYETGHYEKFREMLGQGTVRAWFSKDLLK